MKRRFCILITVMAMIPVVATAQREVRVENFSLIQQRTRITVEFDLALGSRAAAPATILTLTPAIVNGANSRELTPVVVPGRRTGQPTRNGERVKCSATIPFEDWMAGASMVIKGTLDGCGWVTHTLVGTVAEGLMVPASDFTVVEKTVIQGAILSTAEKLMSKFSFVQPAPAGGDYDNLPRTSRASRQQGGISLFFRQGSHSVVPDYRDNYRSLVDLLSVIEEIRSSADSEIDRITITGFSSPEGSGEANFRLSQRRAEAVRRVIEQNTPTLADRISVHAGGEDWEGLREMVAASGEIPYRSEVLRIIDGGGERKERLRSLDGGRVYRQMERTLFPELREATFILVFYKNRQ